jgi:hypothetical protein
VEKTTTWRSQQAGGRNSGPSELKKSQEGDDRRRHRRARS